MMTETLEACAETPSPASKRPAEDEESVSASRQYELQATPTPVSKRRCAGLRDKAASAHAVEAAAAEAAAEAASSTARADAAERDAREMQEHARVLAEVAVRLRAAANEAKMKAEEANKKAERAQLESTAEGRKFLRAMSKEQEKADKKLALETARAQKQQEKDEAIATRSAIKSMGDTIKESLLLVKVQECGEALSVQPGEVSFQNVLFSTFKAVFARGCCTCSPADFGESDASIRVVTEDAASIFGAAKVCGGVVPRAFSISQMAATYLPSSKLLTIAYDSNIVCDSAACG